MALAVVPAACAVGAEGAGAVLAVRRRMDRLRRPVHDTGVTASGGEGDIKAGAAKLKADRAVRLKAEAHRYSKQSKSVRIRLRR
jgi:hypothetical protein